MITRINLDTGERRLLPAWVAFDTQSNPDWEAQDTSVWPIQKFSWRDLTLRRSRNTLQSARALPRQIRDCSGRPGSAGPGGGAALTDRATRQIQGQSDSNVLFAGEAGETNEFDVTDSFGDVSAFFNNGILSTQNLRKQLEDAGRQSADQAADRRSHQKARRSDPDIPRRRRAAGAQNHVYARGTGRRNAAPRFVRAGGC